MSWTLSNLDFEYRWMARGSYRAHPRVTELCRSWRYILRLLPEARTSECLDPEAPIDGKLDQLIPWGVTPSLQSSSFPEPRLVGHFNDKRTSHQLETELGLALPFATIIRGSAELREQVKRCPHDWVLKHPFGVSGRERVLGKCGQLLPAAENWCSKVLQDGWEPVFEPWIVKTEEFSLHFHRQADGTTSFLGCCELLTEASGLFRGNRIGQLEAPDWALNAGQQVCSLLQDYWGPVSFDCCSGTLGGERVNRPLMEINARYSFGRLALALREWAPEGWKYFWFHPAPQKRRPGSLPTVTNVGKPGLYALPEFADPGQQSGTLLGLAPSLDELDQLWSSL